MTDRAFPTAVLGATQQSTTPTSPPATGLTLAGRLLLEERLQLLRATVDELADGLDDPERRADVVEGYHRASTELQRLQALVEAAETLDDRPDDPNRIDLGDRVSIRLEDGTEETYLVVHAAEAVVDDERISVESPLGRALLGQRVGEIVDVTVPGGSYRCTVLTASRLAPSHALDTNHSASQPDGAT